MKTTQTAPIFSPIRRILVPVDAIQTKLSDLHPILSMARRLGASVTLLHCYVTPPSFDFARGDQAVRELSLNRRRVRSRLYELAGTARKLFPRCSCRYVDGSPVTQILRQSQRLLADLIAVPLPLDLVRWCWLPEELLDELVRGANCPVLCVPASQTFAKEPLLNLPEPIEANLLTTDVEPSSHRLATFES
ncbi:MAG TPA: universal stress protein [Chthoniobacterales bacterium]|nr:universal stress protein [Chthoniobacterales bacterium]